MKFNQITLPLAIILSTIILGISFYAVQINKQESIEKQQQIEVEQQIVKDNREYSAERKNDCLSIYQAESDKWNNVNSWNYDSIEDVCEITYKDQDPKPKEVCEKDFEEFKAIFKGDTIPSFVFESHQHCINETFTKIF